MSDPTKLPSSWAEVTIDVLLQPLSDGRLLHHGWSPQCEAEPSPSDDEWGVLKTTAVQDGLYLEEHNKRLPTTLTPRPHLEVKDGDILLTCAGPRNRCGVPCLVRHTRPKLILSGKMYRFRVHEAAMDAAFLEGFLRAKDTQTTIDGMKTGISDSGLNLTHGRFFRLNVPVAPLHEQKRIVAKIDELFSDLDAGVAALERAKVNLKRYRAAVLKAAVEGKLTEAWRAEHPATEPASKLLERILAERRQQWESDQLAKFATAEKEPPTNWREKYKDPAQPETSELPMLPTEWTWATVEQLSTKVVDGVHKKPNYVESGVPFVTVRNLTAGQGISFDQLNFITLADHEEFTKRANPEMGDILISKDGTLGVTRAVRTDAQFSIFVSVALVKPVQRVGSDYLEIAFLSPTVQRQMVGKGSGLQHIHLEDLRQDCIPFPSALEQQQIVAEVAEKLSQIEAAEMEIEHSLLRATRLRESILKQAFEGKLVPQDPKDEPASAMLDRLRASRSGHEGNGKPATPTRTRGRRAQSKQVEGRANE